MAYIDAMIILGIVILFLILVGRVTKSSDGSKIEVERGDMEKRLDDYGQGW